MKDYLNGDRKYGSEEIAQVVARYRASGLTRARFARQTGITPGRLHYWIYGQGGRRRAKAPPRVESLPGFQEVRVATVLSGASAWAVEVTLPRGGSVRFSAAASPNWMGAVVQALKALC